MTGKDRPFSAVESAVPDRAERDPEIEKSGRGDPVQHGEARGGALTGETGNLTGLHDDDGPFVPGELREVSDPRHQGEVTVNSSEASAEHRVAVDDEGGREGPDVTAPPAGQRVTEAASGMGQLQGQGTPVGGGADVGARGRGEGPGPTELAGRESGYGTGQGLAKDDPAYRVEYDDVTPGGQGQEESESR